MKLGTKMLVAPLLIAVMALAAGLVYGVVDYREGERADQANAADNQTRQVIAQAREDVARMRGDVYRTLVLIASLDDATVKASRDKLAQDAKGVQAPLAALVQTSADDEAVRTVTARLATQLAEYLKRCDKAIDLSGMDPNVGAASMRAAEDVYALVAKDLDALGDRIDTLAVLRADAAARLQVQMQIGLAVALLVAMLGAAVVTWRVRRRVVDELKQAVALCEATARGDLALAGASGRVLGADEIGDLQRALGRMVTDLSQALATVRNAAHEIGTASAQIASGNADLSQRTDQAAGSLQQTAASMEQFTGTVQQTAESASQANRLAASASEVAERGGSVVSQVVSTMQAINDSSRRIADIIGTIDGIAFQTNILALNAAVEAARAGEQGRGFAVVASEVRSLAQRSAEAAREIKTLIGASVERVEAGTQQVAQAGSTMTEIVASVRRVSGIIGEISSAAGEQSAGIGLVNAAVAKLDSSTQQNAALVEQSAAAADSLHQQVELLAAVVGRFRLAETPAGA